MLLPKLKTWFLLVSNFYNQQPKISLIIKGKETVLNGTKKLKFSAKTACSNLFFNFSIIRFFKKNSVSEMLSIQQATKLSTNNMRKLATYLNKFSLKGCGVECYFHLSETFFQSINKIKKPNMQKK